MRFKKSKLIALTLLTFAILITSSWFFNLANNNVPFSLKALIYDKSFYKAPQLRDKIHNHLNQCTPHLPLKACRLVYNKAVFLSETFLINFINHFSPETLFVKGPGSPFPIFLFPFFYYGLFKIFSEFKKKKLILSLIFLYAFIPSFFYGFDYKVSILGLFVLPWIMAYGLLDLLEKVSPRHLNYGKLGIMILFFLFLQHLVEMYFFYG